MPIQNKQPLILRNAGSSTADAICVENLDTDVSGESCPHQDTTIHDITTLENGNESNTPQEGGGLEAETAAGLTAEEDAGDNRSIRPATAPAPGTGNPTTTQSGEEAAAADHPATTTTTTTATATQATQAPATPNQEQSNGSDENTATGEQKEQQQQQQEPSLQNGGTTTENLAAEATPTATATATADNHHDVQQDDTTATAITDTVAQEQPPTSQSQSQSHKMMACTVQQQHQQPLTDVPMSDVLPAHHQQEHEHEQCQQAALHYPVTRDVGNGVQNSTAGTQTGLGAAGNSNGTMPLPSGDPKTAQDQETTQCHGQAPAPAPAPTAVQDQAFACPPRPLASGFISSEASGASVADRLFNQRLYPSYTSSRFASGSKYHGKQTSHGHVYDVEVEVQYVDMENSYCCGYLHIAGLTDQYPVLSTFFEGEIIGPKYSFFTSHPTWGADEDVDLEHWTRFPPLRALRHQARQPGFSIGSLLKRDHVFMRWKEQFLVEDHRVRQLRGASFDGFYYVCLDQVKGRVDGIYYHQRSDRYQKLELEHVEDYGCLGAMEVR